jgi:hypothetical protein
VLLLLQPANGKQLTAALLAAACIVCFLLSCTAAVRGLKHPKQLPTSRATKQVHSPSSPKAIVTMNSLAPSADKTWAKNAEGML